MTTHQRRTLNIPVGDISRPGERRVPGTNSAISSFTHQPPGGLSLLAYADRLGPRDYTLALLLDEHRVLTTAQITAILFGSPYTCRNRLHALRRIGFLDRFVPYRPGRSAPVHWVAGPLAARYAALHLDKRPPSVKALRERQDGIVSTRHLAHQVGANQFFVDLLTHARAHPGTRLARWWSAGHSSKEFGGRVRPDGYGIWTDGHRQVSPMVEHDTGNETLGTLAAKLGPYRKLRAEGGPGGPILFWLPSAVREANLHQRLAGVNLGGIVVATAARDTAAAAGLGPADAVWRRVGNGRHRVPLADLPSVTGDATGYNPPPPTLADDPLCLLEG
jgi:Replication-relaxation